MNVLDLFSGAAGGWSLGLHHAGYRTVAAAEIDPWRRQVFAKKWGVPVCEDVRKLGAKWFRDHTGLDRPFLVCGSPPCKEYSAANSKGRGLDTDDLFLEAVRVTSELRPDWAAFENSPRVRTLGYDRIAHEMEAIGYACWPLVVGVASAAAAHRRARVWIVALNLRGKRVCADWPEEQGRPAGQSRQATRICADRRGTDWTEERSTGNWMRRQRSAQGSGAILPDCYSDGLRIEHGRRIGPDGQEAPISFEPRAILGPIGARPLGEHIREYDGLPDWISELCRAAYGDAVSPIIPYAIGQAILAAEGR